MNRDVDGNLQYACSQCEIGTVTQYEYGSVCDTCDFGVAYPNGSG